MDYNTTSSIYNNQDGLKFVWIDYLLFALMLLLSAVIGIYFGSYGRKSNTTTEYIHGGKNMNIIPVGLSLVTTTITGVSLLGNPSEVYMYGTTYWLSCFSATFAVIINNYLYLPVFYELQLTSTYEYLELRFDRSVRLMCSAIFTLYVFIYVPVVVYGPALALSQVSGLNLHFITPVISIVCIIYTMMGGIKAVVWTDFLQGVVMIAACITILALGVVKVGGFAIIWQRSEDGGRIRFFEMDPSPFERLTFWNILIGFTFFFVGVLTNQSMIQKCMSVSTISKSRRSVLLYALGITVIYTISCFAGLIMYAEYYDCDPLTTKAVSKADELMVHYISQEISNFPGILGLFVAGVLSAALSSMSSYLNSVSATLLEDFIRPNLKIEISEQKANFIMKAIVGTFGVICIGMIFIIEKLGLLVQLSASLIGVTGGTMLGIYSFGMFYPRGNAKGALIGGIVSLLFMGWLVFGSQVLTAQGKLTAPSLPRTARGCGFNETVLQSNIEEEVFILYKLSFVYYTLIGSLIVFIVGIPVSVFTKSPKPEQIKLAYFSPVVRRFLRNKVTPIEPKT